MSASAIAAAYRSVLTRRIRTLPGSRSRNETYAGGIGSVASIQSSARPPLLFGSLYSQMPSVSGHACPVEAVAGDAVAVDRAAGVEHHPAAAADEQSHAVRTGVRLAGNRRVRGREPCLVDVVAGG